ncbi:hypothetical protein GGE06_003088 [Streptomyces sp. SFB5A]|jgi:hypothetical protein|uniref:Uncharacterized protein n=1 Tax=Streptomyces nymphaeiformis TaxID=2663842 RepID=A0A7W7TZF8_9ACTN|nr:hypothetical protein [Streptomyces nymphaeiformis]
MERMLRKERTLRKEEVSHHSMHLRRPRALRGEGGCPEGVADGGEGFAGG